MFALKIILALGKIRKSRKYFSDFSFLSVSVVRHLLYFWQRCKPRRLSSLKRACYRPISRTKDGNKRQHGRRGRTGCWCGVTRLLLTANTRLRGSKCNCFSAVRPVARCVFLSPSQRHCTLEEELDKWEACVIYFRRPHKDADAGLFSLGGGGASSGFSATSA